MTSVADESIVRDENLYEDDTLVMGESLAEDETFVKAYFGVIDYVVFSLMLVISIVIGVWSAYKSHGKESTNHFLIGSGNMSPYPVALSLLGGVISAVSILGNATEVYLHGTQMLISLVGVFLGCIVVQQIILPIFYSQHIVSINQYLELRFKSNAVRLLGSVCQLIGRFFYMGLCLYAPSLALSTVTGLSIWVSIILMGAVCTFYISVGGVKAVVYTDVIQTLLMFGGVLLVDIICCNQIGVANVWTIADKGNRIEFFNMNLNPFKRYTFWSSLVLGFYLSMDVLGFSQSSYQRLASVGNLNTAKRLCCFFAVGVWLMWSVFSFSGLVAYAEYRHCDPLTSGKIQKPDQILPHLVMDKLGHFSGIPGIFVAAVYGGVLSSLSTSGNAIACLIWEDFLKELQYFKGMSIRSATLVLKLLSVVAGVSGIFLAMVAGQLGDIFAVLIGFTNYVMSPLYGVFLTGMCAPWVNTKGAMSGFLVSLSYNMWVAVGKFVRGGGQSTHLPLSLDGCLQNSTTHFVTINNTTNFVTTTTSIPDVNNTSDEGKTVYDITFCYFGITGIIITFIISNIVSIFTGLLSPQVADSQLSCGRCVRLHQWLWRVFYESSNTHTNTECEMNHEATVSVMNNMDI